MPTLSDRTISLEQRTGGLRIIPWNVNQLQPASYDCLVGNIIMIPNIDLERQVHFDNPEIFNSDPAVDLNLCKAEDYFTKFTLPDSGWYLDPGAFILCHTLERIELPNYIAARVEGKSTPGRWGLMVHVTAGFIDPGFKGQVTLELKNIGPFRVLLKPGTPISQISFHMLTTAVDQMYKGKYQDQTGVVGGRIMDPGPDPNTATFHLTVGEVDKADYADDADEEIPVADLLQKQLDAENQDPTWRPVALP